VRQVFVAMHAINIMHTVQLHAQVLDGFVKKELRMHFFIYIKTKKK
jgi:hypothetical protein